MLLSTYDNYSHEQNLFVQGVTENCLHILNANNKDKYNEKENVNTNGVDADFTEKATTVRNGV